MTMLSILRTQWRDYPNAHANRINFVVHLICVPMFMMGTTAFFFGLYTLSIAMSLTSLVAMVAAIAIQGWGHSKEASGPTPFTSRANAFVRIFLEQWVTFPGYVLCLAWHKLAN